MSVDYRFACYVNDVVILGKLARAGRRVMARVTRYLTQVLQLKVNPLKSRVCRIKRLEYLSFRFQEIRIVWSERVFADFEHRLRGLTSRRWRASMEYRL
jgi:RNA-directed DNA polymerase